MEGDGSRNEEDVFMKLLPNEGEVPDYKSVGKEDVSISRSQEFENVSDTSSVDSEVDIEVLHYIHNC